MVSIKKNRTVKKLTASQARTEGLQFLGYPSYNPEEDIFLMGQRIDENLEDLFDRVKNFNTKISNKLWVYSVSEHLELVARERAADLLREIELENEKNDIVRNATADPIPFQSNKVSNQWLSGDDQNEHSHPCE